MFSAVLIEKGEAGQTVGVTDVDEAQLPDGSDGMVSVDVEYSTLNYKDGLAITGKSPVVRKFPMVPGIDLAGMVTESSHADWTKGDRVVLNGWGVGETHWGGLAQRARLNGDWLIPLPSAVHHPPGDGDRHRRLHGQPVCGCPAQARGVSRSRRGPRHRRDRRRRERRDRVTDRGRVQSGCGDWKVVGSSSTCSNSVP